MPNGKKISDFSLLKVGHCVHLEAMVLTDAKWKTCQFPSVVGVLRLPQGGYMLFDTGYAQRFNYVTQSFPQRFYRWLTPMHLSSEDELHYQLQSKDIDVSEVKYIFISHFHADHIAGIKDFPGAKFVCSKVAYESFICRAGVSALIKGYIRDLLPEDFEKRVVFIEDTKRVVLSGKLSPFTIAYDLFNDSAYFAIDLPGHAYGHMGLLSPAMQGSNFLIGDACWSERAYKKNIKPNRIASIIMSNYESYLCTLNELSRLHEKNKDINIIPSHCMTTFERHKHE